MTSSRAPDTVTLGVRFQHMNLGGGCYSYSVHCTSGKEPTCQCRRRKRHGFDPWVGKIPWRRAWQPTPVFLPGKSKDREARWASPRGRQEGDTTKATEHHTHVGQWQGPRARSSGTLCEMREASAELRSHRCPEGKAPAPALVSRGILPTKTAKDPHTGTGRVTDSPAGLLSKRTQMYPSVSPIDIPRIWVVPKAFRLFRRSFTTRWSLLGWPWIPQAWTRLSLCNSDREHNQHCGILNPNKAASDL